MSRTIVVVATYAVTTLGAVFGLGTAAYADRPADVEVVVDVDCPHEDSCAVNYDGELGRWTVERVQR